MPEDVVEEDSMAKEVHSAILQTFVVFTILLIFGMFVINLSPTKS